MSDIKAASGYSTHGNRVRYVFADLGATVATRGQIDKSRTSATVLMACPIRWIGSESLRMFLGSLAVVFGNLCSYVFPVRTALRYLERPR